MLVTERWPSLVYGARLESELAREGHEGSNPSLSASFYLETFIMTIIGSTEIDAKKRVGTVKDINEQSRFTKSGRAVIITERQDTYPLLKMNVLFDYEDLGFDPEIGMTLEYRTWLHFSDEPKEDGSSYPPPHPHYEDSYEVISIDKDKGTLEAALADSPYLDLCGGPKFVEQCVEDSAPISFETKHFESLPEVGQVFFVYRKNHFQPLEEE